MREARVHGSIGRHEIEREIVRFLGLDETRRRVERVPKVDHLRGGQSCAISGHHSNRRSSFITGGNKWPSVAICRHQPPSAAINAPWTRPLDPP